MKKILLIPVVILLAVACHKEPVLDSDGEYLVYTAPGKEATFTSFTTFDLADSLLVIGQSTKPEGRTCNHRKESRSRTPGSDRQIHRGITQ